MRLENVPVAYVRYIGMILWPQHLAVFYPFPSSGFPNLAMGGLALLLIAISILAVRYRTQFPYLLVGWLWYLGTIVPVIGIVQVGGQALADRYSYIPSIGLFLIASWGLADLFSRLGFSRRSLAAVEGAAIASCMAMTWLQIGYWHDSVTLWKHAIECADSDLARLNLGQALAEAGALAQAREQLLLALTLNPKNAKANFNLGRLLDEEGKPDQAIARYTEALRSIPPTRAPMATLPSRWLARGSWTSPSTTLSWRSAATLTTSKLTTIWPWPSFKRAGGKSRFTSSPKRCGSTQITPPPENTSAPY